MLWPRRWPFPCTPPPLTAALLLPCPPKEPPDAKLSSPFSEPTRPAALLSASAPPGGSISLLKESFTHEKEVVAVAAMPRPMLRACRAVVPCEEYLLRAHQHGRTKCQSEAGARGARNPPELRLH